MPNSFVNEGSNGDPSCRYKLENSIIILERTNSGILEHYNKFTELSPRPNSTNEGNMEREEIVLSIDESSPSMSSTSLPTKSIKQTQDVGEAGPIEHMISEPKVGITQRRLNLFYFIWLKLIYAYDSGAFSAAVGVQNGIVDEWKLSTTEQGVLISSVFLGTVIGCLFSGHLFSIYNQKKVLILSLIFHTIATFLFALLPFFYQGIVTRFLLGITLSFIVVYVPVWVEEFAPKGSESMWMGSHNVAVPIGVILGYLVCVYFASHEKIGWEGAFYVKCLLMLPTILCLTHLDSQFINASQVSTQNNDSHTINSMLVDLHAPPTAHPNFDNTTTSTSQYEKIVNYFHQRFDIIWKVVHPLLCNTVFMLSVFIMCIMYFIATGLQNFLTQYLREDPFNASMTTITIGFGISILTAPVLGVILGAILLDFCGGYSDDLFRVGVFGLCWSIPGSFFSTLCIFLTEPVSFIVFVALMLFCGGAAIPFATGLTMCSLPEHLRPAGAAFSQIVYNLFGNFSGPIVCSVVTELSGGLNYGVMTLLLTTNVEVILILILFSIAVKKKNNEKATSFGVVVIDSANDASPDSTFAPSSNKVRVWK
ncbi:unnamed protein product [Phytomonas sp. Hart1]|nr:unnamed protein product [Phytomonas sp. Hart1]|eukprot:CCW66304.1 unnamed protein product [Phytomonas sp. isolate Hart1]